MNAIIKKRCVHTRVFATSKLPNQCCIRAAADWQLEQVLKAWEQCLESPRTDIQDLLDFGQKLKAMRPTTTTTETP